MPIVEIKVWDGFGTDNARQVIEEVTAMFERRGIPREAVEVVVTEVPMTHWGIGGTPASERFAGED